MFAGIAVAEYKHFPMYDSKTSNICSVKMIYKHIPVRWTKWHLPHGKFMVPWISTHISVLYNPEYTSVKEGEVSS